jgi:hypothetical protein
MVYLVEGELVIQEKPGMFMNAFVYNKSSNKKRSRKTAYPDKVITESVEDSSVGRIIFRNKRVGEELNQRWGFDLEWVDDIDRARELCRREEIDVYLSSDIIPEIGWGNFLTQRFAEDDNQRTLSGKLNVWNETRFPLSLLYLFSSGRLNDIFEFERGKFVSKPNTEVSGTRTALGIMTPRLAYARSVAQKRIVEYASA